MSHEQEYEFELTLDGLDRLVYAYVTWPARSFYATEPEADDATNAAPEVSFDVHDVESPDQGYAFDPRTWLPVAWREALCEALWDHAQSRYEEREERRASEGR